MSYFVFDLDETLAEMYPMFYFIAGLKLKDTLEEDNSEEAIEVSSSLNAQLNKAYDCFLREILAVETSPEPLGILRPGILSVMKQLAALKTSGKVKDVVIYSNNGHLQSLKFIRDLIHLYLQRDDLIKECIHWNHPMREIERVEGVGAQNKTWFVLRNIMVHGNCKASKDLDPSNVYFFDDLDHPNLQLVLGSNYYKVPAYTYMASFDRLSVIWSNCIKTANVDESEFYGHLLNIFAKPQMKRMKKTKQNIINMFEVLTEVEENSRPLPEQDKGIEIMKLAILKCNSQEGGKRRRKQLTGKTRKTKRHIHKKLKT